MKKEGVCRRKGSVQKKGVQKEGVCAEGRGCKRKG